MMKEQLDSIEVKEELCRMLKELDEYTKKWLRSTTMNYDGMKKLSMEEVKKVELDLLITFDAFCKKHHLRYVLDGGTLIGAMRHQGFIPWDDDIDVAMPFPDFLKFKELYEKECGDSQKQLL